MRTGRFKHLESGPADPEQNPDTTPAPPVTAEGGPPPPDFQWLHMRIQEEKERRDREAMILDRLPRAAAELHRSLSACVESYNTAFGLESVGMESQAPRTSIVVRETPGAQGRERAKIEILIAPAIPGFQIDRGGSPLVVEVGMLPGDKLFYRDRDKDQYLSMEELTRRILDRALFPKLGE
jgi:hypothetical protein